MSVLTLDWNLGGLEIIYEPIYLSKITFKYITYERILKRSNLLVEKGQKEVTGHFSVV